MEEAAAAEDVEEEVVTAVVVEATEEAATGAIGVVVGREVTEVAARAEAAVRVEDSNHRPRRRDKLLPPVVGVRAAEAAAAPLPSHSQLRDQLPVVAFGLLPRPFPDPPQVTLVAREVAAKVAGVVEVRAAVEAVELKVRAGGPVWKSPRSRLLNVARVLLMGALGGFQEPEDRLGASAAEAPADRPEVSEEALGDHLEV